MYDFVNDGTTTIKHIDAYAGPDVDSNSPLHTYGTTWPFEDKTTGEPTTYQWIPGTHKFFGWLAKDANFGLTTPMTPETFFNAGFAFLETDKKLNIKTAFIIGIATSIDACAAGVTLFFINTPIMIASSIIGIVSFINSIAAFYACSCLRKIPTKYIEIFSGIILISLGFKVLLEHLLS